MPRYWWPIILIKMFKYLIAALLLAASINLASAQDAFLTPPFPPTAFLEQYYEVRFRVYGLSAPTFTFTNLPNFLKGTADGVVSGTPNTTGTFNVGVSYTSGNTTGSSKVVISITQSPNTAASAAQNQAVVGLIIQTATSTWTYRSGSKINIQQSSSNGVAPITWNYNNLPAGLSGDNSGQISGSIANAGLYSFSCSCGDSKGQKAQSYYTLNIQPGTLIASTFLTIQPTTSLTSPTKMPPSPSSTTSPKSRTNKSPPITPSPMPSRS